MGLLPFITCSRLQLYQYQYNVSGKDEAMDVITYSEARANLKGIMDQVVSDRTHVVVTRQKAESIVMVSLEDWNAIEETMYLLSNRTNSDRLRQSIEQLDGQGGNERGLIEP
jgi:antitoxin YefM